MLEGYKPIDFSSMDLSQLRNRVGLSQAAMNILATSKWNNTPINSLLSAGLTATGEAPPREQTLWGRAIDALSTPIYAVTNAVDDAIAGHQSSDSDSVLADIGEIIGGAVTGAGRGAYAGLRGGFAPSETAADPTDKIYLGDALIRLDTHMSAEEAMDPSNREEVRRRLEQKKVNQMGGNDPTNMYFYDWDKGQVEVTDEDIDQYFRDMGLYGIGASAVADPLNFISAPSKIANLLKGNKGTAEIPKGTETGDLFSSGFRTLDEDAPINTGEPLSINPASMSSGTSPTSYKTNVSPGSVQNQIATPDWFDFPSSPADIILRTTDDSVPVNTGTAALPRSTTVNTSEDIAIPEFYEAAPVAKIPDEQIAFAEKFSNPEQINKLTSAILRSAATGDAYTAIDRITSRFPGIPFEQTTKLLEHLSTLKDFSRRLAIPAERKKIIGAFNRVIHADAQAMKTPPKVKPAAAIVNDATEIGPLALDDLIANTKPKKSSNLGRDAAVIDETYKKFESQILGTATPTGIRNTSAYNAAVASGKTARYSGSQQVQMWNYITNTLKNVKSPNRFAVANNLLRQVEDMFMAKGAIPMSGYRVNESVTLRLSQVLDAIGPAAAAMNPTLLTKILRGEPEALAKLPAEVLQRIEEIKAGEAVVDASSVVKGVDAAAKNIEDLIKGPLSAARTEEVVTIGSRVAEDITRTAGGSPVAANNASVITKEEFLPKDPLDSAVKSANLNTTALISHPDVSPALLRKYSSAPSVARAISRSLNTPSIRQMGKKWGPAAQAVEWLGARFNAAYKNSDMRPIYLKNAATAKATVARRAEYLNNLAKNYDINDSDLWNDALKASQGRMAAPEGSPARALSQEILQVMENLFGSSGLKNSIALENSVAGRSQLYMKELNRNLKRFGLGQYQFTKKGDYAEGTKWLNSWESWNIERPLEFLFKVQNVVEHTVREKIMFDEIIGRFGTYKKGQGFTYEVKSHPRLAGAYFGKQAASQVEQFVKNLKDISQTSSKSLQNFDKALSKWKAAVTIYVPSHHIRNIIGDLYFNWLGGVNSTRPYSTALRVMQSQRGRYEGLAEMSALTNPNALKKVITTGQAPGAIGKQTALTMKNGTNVTNDMVYVSAFQQGILPTTRVLEDIPDDVATGFERIKPLGGRGQKAAHSISEGRDHYVRLAHYIDQLKKSNRSFETATEEAAAVVRKWHPDGMDLTKFERNVMRRMFPFYSWTRKAFPLIVESLVATPGKVMAYPKAQYLLQNMLGIQTGPMSDPFPYDQLFPDWIREKGIGPIMGEPGSYTVVNPGNPTMDLIAQASNPGPSTLGMINPAARIPIELATGREVQTGAPHGGLTDLDYIAKQIPGISHAGRVTGEFGVSDTTKSTSEGLNMQNILNLLTALGMQNTGPYIKSAEFDLRDYLKGN